MTSESLGDLSGCRLKEEQKGKNEIHSILEGLRRKSAPPTFCLTNTALVQGFITTYWNYCKSLQFSFLPPDSPAYSLFSTLLTRVTLTPRACMLSRFSCAQLFVTLWTVARQAPLSMGFPRQECWIGLLYSLPGDLPDPRIKPGSPTLQVDSLPSEPLERSNSSAIQLQQYPPGPSP